MTDLKTITLLEKEKATLTDKLSQVQSKKEDVEARLTRRVQELQAQLEQAAHGAHAEDQEIQQLQGKLRDLDKERAEQTAHFEREQLLWQDKCEFLTQQRDHARSDLQEAQKKLQAALEQLQRRGSLEKDKLAQATAVLVESTEKRCAAEVAHWQAAQAAAVQELHTQTQALHQQLQTAHDALDAAERRRRQEITELQGKMQIGLWPN